MPVVKPFRPFVFNSEKLQNLENYITPPYDVIPESKIAYYKNRSPFNMVHLIKNKNYDEVAVILEKMKRESVIKRFEKSCYLLYRQTFFIDAIGASFTRTAIVSLTQLYDYSDKKILPHEKTLDGPKEDRMRLLERTEMNFGYIFMFYKDESGLNKLIDNNIESIKKNLVLSFTCDDNIFNELCIIPDELNNDITKMFANEVFYIADGHHRYDTSLSYARKNVKKGEEVPQNYIMTGAISMKDQGLFILPIYRVLHSIENYNCDHFIKRLEEYFNVEEVSNKAEMIKRIEKFPKRYVYGFQNKSDGRCMVASAIDDNAVMQAMGDNVPEELKELGVITLHKLVFEKIFKIDEENLKNEKNVWYAHSLSEVDEMLEKESACMAVYLKPTTLDDVKKIADCSMFMPQKSTFFYPKLYSGVTMNSISEF